VIPSLGWFRRRVFAIAPVETTFARRGFRESEAAAHQHLQQIGRTFLQGYHAALEEDQARSLTLRLNAVDLQSRRFAFEGAAMTLAPLDHLVL
jgi:hypothetical protein